VRTTLHLEMLGLLGTVALLGGCGIPPPASQLPSASAAIDRMRATLAPCTGVQAGASFEVSRRVALVFSGSVRGDVLLYAASPSRVRLDIVSSFGISLATLTSDGTRFAFADLREKRFSVGEASACNIARFTTVPMPPNVLVDLLLGRAPVLKHVSAGTIEWSGDGYYVVTIPGTRDASEEIRLAPAPADLRKPWSEQRMRVVGVKVQQYGSTLYDASLAGHARAPMAKERVDADGIDPPIPPSGPLCEAELPRRIHIEVPDRNEELDLRYKDVAWNPPLPDGIFEQSPPPGLPVVPVRCE
ncbi:MAG TPA: hypothetical protein VLT33_51945, partial [Labilithrix sp.]|nr:hypothetical protein [Labilithrix sp.]